MRTRKRLVEETANHERWLVSYADFITLLFAFFVVMYASSSVNASKYKQVAESMGSAFSAKPAAIKEKEIPKVAPVVIPEALAAAPAPPDATVIQKALQSTIDELSESRQSLQKSLQEQLDRQENLQTALSVQSVEKENMHGMLENVNNQLRKSTELNKILAGANNARAQLLENIQLGLFSQGVQVEIDVRNGILRLPETLLFDSGKAELREGGVKALRILSENLMRILPCYAESDAVASVQDSCSKPESSHRMRLESLFIEGHTDSVPIANSMFKDNWDLSIARAKNTYLELIKVEPALEKLENERQQPLVSFSAYSGRRPIVENTNESTRRKNRRIDLRFIMAQPSLSNELASLNPP